MEKFDVVVIGSGPAGEGAAMMLAKNHRKMAAGLNVTLPQLLSQASGVIEAQVQMRRRFYERNRVPVLEGAARFVDANTLEVAPQSGEAYTVGADRFVIATGSRPYHPPGLDFS